MVIDHTWYLVANSLRLFKVTSVVWISVVGRVVLCRYVDDFLSAVDAHVGKHIFGIALEMYCIILDYMCSGRVVFGSGSVRIRFVFGSGSVRVQVGFGSGSVRIRVGFGSYVGRLRVVFGSASVGSGRVGSG